MDIRESKKQGVVLSINISSEKGTIKSPASEAQLDEEGIVGDAHRGKWHRQVSLLSQESINHFEKTLGKSFSPGEFGENITTQGLVLETLELGTHIKIGSCELEVTQIGKTCHGDGCEIFRQVGKCVMPKKGIFCQVTKEGTLRPGEIVKLI